MKKVLALIISVLTPLVLSVSAFAGAPSILDSESEIINTGGDYMPVVYIAIGALALAVIAGIVLFVGGKKKK